MYQRCVIIVLEGADEEKLDEVTDKMEDHLGQLAKESTLPDGIKVSEVYSIDPDDPDDGEDDDEAGTTGGEDDQHD